MGVGLLGIRVEIEDGFERELIRELARVRDAHIDIVITIAIGSYRGVGVHRYRVVVL